jgi:hypothetical protein
MMMVPFGEKDNYQAVVPFNRINPKWDIMYLIEVMDKNGKGMVYPDFNTETPYKILKINRN